MGEKLLIIAEPKVAKNSVPNAGFSAKLRLCEQGAIQHIFKAGKKRSFVNFNAFFCVNQLSHPRICIAISKKQIPKAYLRNSIKRFFRESFRLSQYQLPPCDIIVVVYKAIMAVPEARNKREKKQKIHQYITVQWQKLIHTLQPS